MRESRILLFYLFTPLADPVAVRMWQRLLCERFGLRGRILVSPHGINATVGGEIVAVKRYARALREYEPFADVDLKWAHGSGLTPEPGPSGWHESVDFPKLSVRARDELVAFGVQGEVRVDEDGVVGGGGRLSPQALHELVAERGEEVVFLDGRNAREAEIGRFDGAIVPDVETTHDFVRRLEDGSLDAIKGRPVVTYCTGGVRCEILSSLMRERGFDEVYQLDGGIVRYGEAYGDGGLWRGALYVFDGRGSITFSDDAEVLGRCHACGEPTHAMETLDLPRGRIQRVTCPACQEGPERAAPPLRG